jgi:hypothetical protein
MSYLLSSTLCVRVRVRVLPCSELCSWSVAALFQTPLLSTLPGSGPIGFPPSVRPINLSPQPLPIAAPMGPSPPSNNHSSPSGVNKEGPTSLSVASPGHAQVSADTVQTGY